MKVQFNKIGMDPAYDSSPEDFRKYLQNEIISNGNIIKAIGLKFE
jgi:tripartite-type tricarboxylate transporter receptor subunit TctC